MLHRSWIAVALAALLVLPNLAWNAAHGWLTVAHLGENAALDGPLLNPGEMLEFLGAQFGVFGPILFGALLVTIARVRREIRDERMLLLLCFVVPMLAAIALQALLSRAYANWAAPAYLAGTVAVVLWMMPRARGWLAAGLALNAAICVAVAVVVTVPRQLPDTVRAATMDRYLGRVELSRAILAEAEARGLDTIVARNRDVLADLFYTGRDAPQTFRAVPPEGRPPHHYAMSYAFEGSEAPVLYVGDGAPRCVAGAAPLATLAPEPGYWATRPKSLWQVPGDCWEAR